MNKKRLQTLAQLSKKLIIALIVAVSLTVFLLGGVEKVYAASNLLEYQKPGDIIRFAGEEWILLNPSERYIVMKDYWLKDGKPVTAPFNTKKTNKFDPNQKENIGYVLNTEYYNTLRNKEKEMVSESAWDISPFLGVGIQTVSAKIGLLSLREWLEYKSVLGNPSWIFWTLTPHPQNKEQVFAIGADGNSNAWSTWKPEWPTVTHPALKLKPGVFVNPLTKELQPLTDDKDLPMITFEPNGNTEKQKVHSMKVWVYDWFGSGVEEATYRWKKDDQYVTGNIRMNEFPMIISTPNYGEGDYYLEVTAFDAAWNQNFQVSKPFVVGRLDVTEVETLADIEVDYGTSRSALSLPSSVQVSLEDQSSTSLGVTWDNGSPAYNGNAVGEYTFTGTLVENQDVVNPQNLKVQVKVRVKPKPLEVISVTPLDALSVEYGTSRSSLPLPSTVQVTLNDGNNRSLGVTWDTGSPTYNGNTAGEYMFTSTLAEDVANPQNLKAEVKVIVKSKSLEVKSVESLADIVVAYGTSRSSLSLPFTVQVTLSDGKSRSLGVAWNGGNPSYDGNTAGEYTFTGMLAEDVENPRNLKAEVKVVVKPKPADPTNPSEPVQVESVEVHSDIEVSYGTSRSSLSLPSTVQVTLSDGNIRSLDVTWNNGNPAYNGNTAGEYRFTGTLSQDVLNPQGLTAEVKVVVKPKPADPDSEMPTWPNGSALTISDITQTSVKLSWPSAIDKKGVTGYRIDVDGTEYQTVMSSVSEQTVMGLKAGTIYTFTIKAFNDAGKESAPLSTKATTARSSRSGGGGGSGGGSTLSGNADLEELQAWVNDKKLEFSPSFTAGTTIYTAQTEAEQIEIVAKPAHSTAKMILQDKVMTDRTKVHLEEGDNKLVLIVQAENGNKKEYRLNIRRETPKPSEQEIHFTDIAGHWAESYIKQASARGIVGGYPDGTFKPNASVTRGEFTVMLVNALKLEDDATLSTFSDDKQIGAWAKQAIDRAVQAGIIAGYDDGSFRPSASITRAEMAVMFARAMDLQFDTNAVSPFADDKTIPEWAKGAVDAVHRIGIVNGRGENQFVPNGTAMRAEAITMLIRMLEREES